MIIRQKPLLQSSANSLTGISSPLKLRLSATPQQLAAKFSDSLTSEASASVKTLARGLTESPTITGNMSPIIFTDRKSRYKAHDPAKIYTMPDIMKAVVYFHNYYLTPVKEWYKESRPRVTIHIYADNGGDGILRASACDLLAHGGKIRKFRSCLIPGTRRGRTGNTSHARRASVVDRFYDSKCGFSPVQHDVKLLDNLGEPCPVPGNNQVHFDDNISIITNNNDTNINKKKYFKVIVVPLQTANVRL